MTFVLSIIGALVIAWIVAGWLDDYEASIDERPYDWAESEDVER